MYSGEKTISLTNGAGKTGQPLAKEWLEHFLTSYKKSRITKAILRKNQLAWLQALIQSHSHQDSMVLAQRQKYRSMEQNRKPRDKSMHLWTPYFRQRGQEYTMD